MSEFSCTVASVHAYPIKSCGGIRLSQGLVTETGLDLDRAWMVVDAKGQPLTQREYPRMALVQCAYKGLDLLVRAPGMLSLHLHLDRVEQVTEVWVGGARAPAYDMGALAAQWFTDFLQPGQHAPGLGLRLVRFDPEHPRVCDLKEASPLVAQTAFADECPLLVTSLESLQDLNERMVTAGAAPLGMARFRPNLVLRGLPAYAEEGVHRLLIHTAQGEVELRLAMPCIRCSIPNIDPETAELSPQVGALLSRFRAKPHMGGEFTFGMYAAVMRGLDCALLPGQKVDGLL